MLGNLWAVAYRTVTKNWRLKNILTFRDFKQLGSLEALIGLIRQRSNDSKTLGHI